MNPVCTHIGRNLQEKWLSSLSVLTGIVLAMTARLPYPNALDLQIKVNYLPVNGYDASSHEIVAVDLILSNVTDAEVLANTSQNNGDIRK